MTLALIRQAALGTVFATSLMGCVSEAPAPQARDSAPTTRTEASLTLDRDSALQQAQAERQSGRIDAARATLARLLIFAPDDPQVLGEYGKTLIAEGRNGDALLFLERAVALEPDEWSLHSARGVAYDLIGAHLQAQTAYERALAINPGEPTVLSNDALSHMEVGDLDTAERLLMEASQNGADPRIKQNLAMIHDMKARAPQPATPMPLAMLPVQADGAMQPNLETMLEVAPLVDVTPAPDVAASVPVATSDDMWQEDQATRGETIALDPAVADEPQAPVVAVETMESPKQDDTATKPETTAAPAKKSPTKTVSAKAAKPKPTAKTAPSSKPLHGPRGNDEVPATQTASGK